MGADYQWSERPGDEQYHVFQRCKNAKEIEKVHRRCHKKRPEGRTLSGTCIAIMRKELENNPHRPRITDASWTKSS